MDKSLWQVLVLTAFLGATGSAATLAANTVYKWTDDEGGVHYGTRAPKGKQSLAITPKTGHSEPVNYSAQSSSSEAQSSAASTETAAQKNAERCKAARHNLKTLRQFGRIRVEQADGTFRVLNKEEQQQKVQETQNIVDEEC